MVGKPAPLVFVCPALVAAFPAAYVAVANRDEITGWDAALGILALALAGVIVHAVVALVAHRRCTPSTVAVIAALINGVLFGVVLVAEQMPLRFRYAVLLLAAPLLLLAGRLWWRGGHRPVMARALLVGTSALYVSLLVRPLARMPARREIRAELAHAGDLSAPIAGTPQAGRRERPDIWVILVDTYGSEEVLGAVYGVNIRAFEDSLRALGFVVPAVRANYSSTAFALASLLNAAYLDSLARLDGQTRALWPLYELIYRDRVTAFLAKEGYDEYVVPSVPWIGTLEHSRARIHLTTPTVGPMRGRLIRDYLLYAVLPHTVAGRILPFGVKWSTAENVLAGFEGAREVAGRRTPKFVLVHSMAAHFPFTVRADCSPLDEPNAFPERQGPGSAAAYTDGIRCTNREVLSLVREILRRSRTRPIILIQGDHGPRGLGIPWSGPAEHATAAQVVERLTVFGAYLTPGPVTLPDTVTPVDVMRTVLARYLGADLPPLPSRSLHSTTERPYRFYEVPTTVFTDSAPRLFGAGADGRGPISTRP